MTTKKPNYSATDSQKTDSPSNNHLANTALYRKHRPQDWQSVSGQAHIVSILESEAKKEYPSHAFLFAGSRGTGKTTLARIFAKNIGTAPEDIYEIDAASNTSVEDIRVLNEAVYALPMNSKFKVYILDEVHMLSKSAFNAFLKTLEEPPKHVIFILATTELHKIPETIISRCQVFHFKKPSIETLADVAKSIFEKEWGKDKVPSRGELELFAQFGNGSFRDMLSRIQTFMTLVNPGDNSNVMEVLGAPNKMLISDFVSSVMSDDGSLGLKNALDVLQKIESIDTDVRLFTDLLIYEFRDELIYKSPAGIGVTKKHENLVKILDLLIRAKGDLGKTDVKVLPLELALFKFFAK